MNTVLRFIGIANAAVWLGSAFFFVFVVDPAFSTPKMLGLLDRTYSEAAVQLLLERYYLLHYICSFIALIHLFAEWLYLARPLTKFMLGLVLGLLGLGIFGGGQLQPRLETLHVTQHIEGPTKTEKQEAARSFQVWSRVADLLNFVIIIGVTLHLWRVVHPGESTRFFSLNKIRG